LTIFVFVVNDKSVAYVCQAGEREFVHSKATKEGEIFGAHLRKLRVARGLTQGEVAESCATSIAFISNLERGLMLPGLAVLLRFADALECNVSVLVEVLDRRRSTSSKSRKK
jgi:predicted transcriptional regulator